MEDKDLVQAYIDLYKQQMNHFHKTQEVEWKGNFGVWTLLAAAIYLVAQNKITVSIWIAVVPTALISIVHWFWLWQIHKSEAFDRMLWIRFRRDARLILLGKTSDLPQDEEFRVRTDSQRIIWLLLEVGMSVVLSAILVATAVQHKASSPVSVSAVPATTQVPIESPTTAVAAIATPLAEKVSSTKPSVCTNVPPGIREFRANKFDEEVTKSDCPVPVEFFAV